MTVAQVQVSDFAGCLLVTTHDDIGAEVAGRIGALAAQASSYADLVLNLRDGCVIDHEAIAALAELRNVLEMNGGSLRIVLPGRRSHEPIGTESGLFGCIFDDLADALEVTLAVRADRSETRSGRLDPRWH